MNHDIPISFPAPNNIPMPILRSRNNVSAKWAWAVHLLLYDISRRCESVLTQWIVTLWRWEDLDRTKNNFCYGVTGTMHILSFKFCYIFEFNISYNRTQANKKVNFVSAGPSRWSFSYIHGGACKSCYSIHSSNYT